jgi:NADH-quinone oxidoreductase subunit H
MGMLGPALLANTWSISEMSKYYSAHPWYVLVNMLGFVVCIVSIQGKLEKAPFDIPEAETEIVAGGYTEYSGRLFAMLRLTLDIEMIVGASLLAAVFMPFFMNINPILGFFVYLIKVIFLVFLFSLGRTIFARMRMDQMIAFCWKYLVPLSLFQIFINLVLKGILK